MNTQLWSLIMGSVALLATATVIAKLIQWNVGPNNATVSNLLTRIYAWWVMVGVMAVAFSQGTVVAACFFTVLSMLALREFASLSPVTSEDKLPLLAAFFVATPLQYYLIAINWYGLYSILLPVYGFFVLAALSMRSQQSGSFLERAAKLQWAMMVCVYGVSHAPALLTLDIPGYDSSAGVLLVFFALVAQMSDVLQYVCGKLFGKHKLAPVLSPNKTVEGLVGGGLLAVALGASLFSFTPFTWWQAGLMSLAIVIAGSTGGLVLSAVKRALGAKDWGSSIPGHGGVMDRLDSIAFSAPIFFHLTRYWFVP